MEWWQSAVFYQIYPRSFADSDGDGTGDLAGITARLDYLQLTLGVNALWISPFYRSPMRDNGYDVQDYYSVDSIFGDMADFAELVREAKARDLRVVMDWIPNHTSDSHEWFLDSRGSRSSRRRDWYVWRDSAPDGGPPNNWRSFFPRVGSAWTFDPPTGQWYLHSFLPSQPDLNWDNPEVEVAMHDTARFWLDRGVDGFRIDALPLIAKDALLRANSDGEGPWGQYNIDWHTIHGRLRRLRALCNSYGQRVLIGEVNVLDLKRLAQYLTSRDELHLAHNFLFTTQPWEARAIADFIRYIEECVPAPALPSWYLGNHDNSRIVSRLGGGRIGMARARTAALLLLTVRGVPFIYQGEELGLPDSPVPEPYRHDIDGREPQRVPMPWAAPSQVRGGGFTAGSPWLPLHDLAESLNVAAETGDPGSMLALYQRLIRLRAETEALQAGDYVPLPSPDGTLCFARQSAHSQMLVLLNFTDRPTAIPMSMLSAPRPRILLSTDSTRSPDDLDMSSVKLGPNEGLIVGFAPSRDRDSKPVSVLV
jgi:alpha-glucosidase